VKATSRQSLGHRGRILAEHLSRDPLHARLHLDCCPPRESHQKDAARIGAIDDQMGDAMGKGIGLARAGPRDDQQRRCHRTLRRHAVLDGAALLGI
jgi:hypothetical protein